MTEGVFENENITSFVGHHDVCFILSLRLQFSVFYPANSPDHPSCTDVPKFAIVHLVFILVVAVRLRGKTSNKMLLKVVLDF